MLPTLFIFLLLVGAIFFSFVKQNKIVDKFSNSSPKFLVKNETDFLDVKILDKDYLKKFFEKYAIEFSNTGGKMPRYIIFAIRRHPLINSKFRVKFGKSSSPAILENWYFRKGKFFIEVYFDREEMNNLTEDQWRKQVNYYFLKNLYHSFRMNIPYPQNRSSIDVIFGGLVVKNKFPFSVTLK